MKALPRGATPIDFAYAIHTDVGHQCVGARVNGKMVPLRTRLKNGDIVEIVTQAGHKPSRDWLNFVVTSRARNKIKHFVQLEEKTRAHRARAQAVREGSAALRPEPEDAASRATRSRKVADEFGGGKADELFARDRLRQALGANSCSRKLVPADAAAARSRPKGRVAPAVKRVLRPGRGEASRSAASTTCWCSARAAAIRFAARRSSATSRAARASSVHSATCPNVVNLLYDPERRIDVEWDKGDARPRATP